jgi:hypothetical protein
MCDIAVARLYMFRSQIPLFSEFTASTGAVPILPVLRQKLHENKYLEIFEVSNTLRLSSLTAGFFHLG